MAREPSPEQPLRGQRESTQRRRRRQQRGASVESQIEQTQVSEIIENLEDRIYKEKIKETFERYIQNYQNYVNLLNITRELFEREWESVVEEYFIEAKQNALERASELTTGVTSERRTAVFRGVLEDEIRLKEKELENEFRMILGLHLLTLNPGNPIVMEFLREKCSIENILKFIEPINQPPGIGSIFYAGEREIEYKQITFKINPAWASFLVNVLVEKSKTREDIEKIAERLREVIRKHLDFIRENISRNESFLLERIKRRLARIAGDLNLKTQEGLEMLLKRRKIARKILGLKDDELLTEERLRRLTQNQLDEISTKAQGEQINFEEEKKKAFEEEVKILMRELEESLNLKPEELMKKDPEELKQLLEQLNQTAQVLGVPLEELRKATTEEEKKKANEKLQKALESVKDIAGILGGMALSGFLLWFSLIGFFFPVWAIEKMQKEIKI
ncbi:MAG: hypothetical protein KatS3mg094_549 [Candidatus Parcubacteria bacterium]|nr:MAG: hypothetical protein KatS3mg094_549 [Candidatus Parcubacteria bacterium]